MTSVNSNLPALKYGRDIEITTVNTFADFIKNYQQDYIKACGKACIEIKCPYSENDTEPNEQNLDYLYKDGDVVKIKQSHKYFTHCLFCCLDYARNVCLQKQYW